MATYNAGEARATYILESTAAEQAQARLIAGYRQLAQLEAQRRQAPSGGASRAASDEVRLAQALARTATAEARKAAETNKAARITQDAARSNAQAALAEQRRQTELAKTAREEARAAQSALNLAQARERAARQSQNGGLGPALPRTFAGFTPGGLAQAAGALGVATIGPQIVGQAVTAGVGAGREALALERTLALTRALSGDTKTYNQVIAAARQQQELYGGSLRDTVAALSGLTIQSRSSGAELSTLIDLSQRLAVLDPAQGLEGAQIALREALSGDTRSLALRFEIPRAALVKLKDATLPVNERLQVLNDYLNQVGITSKTVGDTVSETARAYNGLGRELGDLQTNVGTGLAGAFEGAATGLGRLIGLVNDNPQAIAEVRALLTGQPVTPRLVEQATAEVAQRTEQRESGGRSQLERQQINAAVAGLGQAAAAGADVGVANVERLAAQLERLGQSSAPEVRRAAAELAALYLETGNAGEIEGRVNLLADAQKNLTSAIPPYLEARRSATAEEQIAAEQQAGIDRVLSLVRQGYLNQADAVLLLESTYPGLAGKAGEIIASQIEIERVTRAATQALRDQQLADQQAQTRELAAPLAPLGGPGRQGNDVDDFFTFLADQAAAEEARRDQIRQTGTEVDRVRLAQQEYNEAIKEFGAGSAQAIRAETALRQAREPAGRGRRAATGITAEDRADLKLLADDQARLAALQTELAQQGNQESLKAKQIKGQILDLERKIATEQERQNAAQVDAQLGAVRDQQARLKEARELAQNQRIIGGAGFSAEQKRAAELRNQEIALEQQKRALDIEKDARTAGIARPELSQPLPIPNVATLPPTVPAGPVPPPAGAAAPAAATAPTLVLNLTIEEGRLTAVDAGGVALEVLVNGAAQAGASGTGG